MSIIPVICVHAATIAQAHEKALKELWKNGIRIKTQYDGPEDPPSIDATANITIDDPLADPMIHKAFPGGIEDLREYVMELSGLKDHWVRNMNDADDKRWEYTYHSRFADWGSHYELVSGNRTIISPFDGEIDQIDIVAKKLAQCSYTRRAQMITWMPYMDNDIEDPPCIQSLYFRITEEITEDMMTVWHLHTNVRIRSNDAWGASFMNLFGITMFVRDVIIPKINEYRDVPSEIYMARLNWQADSYHIYGKDISDFKKRFIDKIGIQPPEKRFYNFYDPLIQEIYSEAEEKVLKKIADYDATHPR